MKKFFLTAIIAVMISGAYAQSARFGIKGGLNIANLKVDNVNNTDSRTGFHLGALAHIHVSPQFAIQPEVVYSAQGMNVDLGDGELKWNLNYINVPVMLQYMAGNGFRLETGPQLGLLAGANIESESGNKEEVKEDFNSIDVSWGFGASYLTKSNIGIGARYNLGLNNINDAGANEIKNRVFQVGLFYMLK